MIIPFCNFQNSVSEKNVVLFNFCLCLYTNGTKKLWDFNIAAGIQQWSKLQIYVCMYVIEGRLKTSTQNGKEVVTHITHMIYMEGWRGHFQFQTFSRRFVYCWHLTMQGMRAWPKLSNYRRRSQKWYSINCGHDSHVFKTNIRTFIHSFYSHCHGGAFSWSIKFSVDLCFCAYWMAIRSMCTDITLGI